MMLCGCCLGGRCPVDGDMLVVLWWCCVDAVVFIVLCRWWCVDAVVMMLLCRWWCVDGVVGWGCVADSVLMVVCRWCSDDGIVLMVMCRWCCDDEDEAEGGAGSGRRRQNNARKTKTSQSDGGKNGCLILLWRLHPLTLHKTLCYAVMFRKQCHDADQKRKKGRHSPHYITFRPPLFALK